MRQSAGMMVNYVYRLSEVERNHEAYARDRSVVASRRFELLGKESLLACVRAATATVNPPKSPSGHRIGPPPWS